ncbi:hypothetical protein LIER_02236 [Lithospermum erythrorhizon]|uniref:Reverse transcriptase/retrotransposon-derived protein RNase H-like domain-containing protein n=1 Tax=Lithospermum erythrorhizon TaxID=34254 RepID=A0AAV3NNQ2_LITER
MLIKSKVKDDHLSNLRESLERLRDCRLRINPEKCYFGVTSGNFLGFMITERGIEPNPDKIDPLRGIDPPNTYKEESFEWNEEYTKPFSEPKEYLGSPKLLTRPEEGEDLQLYLAISEGAVSSMLVREAEGNRKSIYYVSHVLHVPDESYPLIDKFVLAIVMTARKLKAYFEAHPIKVLTDQPVKRVLSTRPCRGGWLYGKLN